MFANSVIIKGKITDSSEIGIEGVSISVKPNTAIESDIQGVFSLTVDSDKDIKLEVSADGYLSQSMNLKLQDENISDLIIKLEKNHNLDEVVVQGGNSIETATKTLLFPTALERKHSATGYDLLSIMNLPDINSDRRTQSVTNIAGQKIQLCINGIDASPEDVTTLSPRDILRIEYQHVPSGKYVGKPAVINFITKKWSYGGNIFLNADECFGYLSGNYLAYADVAHKETTYSLTANGKWISNGKGVNGIEEFSFNNQEFTRATNTIDGNTKENSEYLQFRAVTQKKKYSLKSVVRFIRKATPENYSLDSLIYNGTYNMRTLQQRCSNSTTYSPSALIDYTQQLKNNQSLNIYLSASYNRNNYNSFYSETGQQDIYSTVKEDAYDISGYAYYTKSFKNNITLGGYIAHYQDFYKDIYSGTNKSKQVLSVGQTLAMAQLQHVVNDKFYYYLQGGLSNEYTNLNEKIDNYLNPMFYLGANYTINENNSLSLNANYTNKTFNPSSKNDAVQQISFFEITKGNPNLDVTRCFQNTLSYNTAINKLNISATYDFLVYFDNSSYSYTNDSDYVIKTLVNDGKVYWNNLMLSITYSLFNNNLRLKGLFSYDYTNLNGNIYNEKIHGVSGGVSATYIYKDWVFNVFYTAPTKNELYIATPQFVDKLDTYGLSVSWSKKAWNINLGTINFLDSQRGSHKWYDYGIYSTDSKYYSNAQGRNIYIDIAYSFSFGRETKRGDTGVNMKTNNAILKNY